MADKDRVHGSLEVLEKLYRIYKEDNLTLSELFNLITNKYPSFAILYSFYEFIKNSGDLNDFIEKMYKNREKVEREALRLTQDFTRIFTYSRSSQVKDYLLKKDNLEIVYLTEGRPHNEGILLARELADKGIDVKLSIDAAMEHFIKESDAIVIGSDAVFDCFFINKIGTSLVIKIAELYQKPVFVLALYEKRIKKEYEKYYKILDEPEDEILNIPNEKIRVFNRYFEKVYFTKNIKLIF